jgi:DNA-binding response OmpR family regulator
MDNTRPSKKQTFKSTENTIEYNAIFRDEISIGTFRFSPDVSKLTSGLQTFRLSLREVQILTLLVENLNKVINRKTILLQVWGDDSMNNSRNLDVYMRKLRGYLAGDPTLEIITLRGKGFQFNIKTY